MTERKIEFMGFNGKVAQFCMPGPPIGRHFDAFYHGRELGWIVKEYETHYQRKTSKDGIVWHATAWITVPFDDDALYARLIAKIPANIVARIIVPVIAREMARS